MNAIGLGSSLAHNVNIGDTAWGKVAGTDASSWVFATDMEKAAHHGAAGTGENLSTGGLLNYHIKNVGNTVGTAPSRAYLTTISDAVLELRDSGANVYS